MLCLSAIPEARLCRGAWTRSEASALKGSAIALLQSCAILALICQLANTFAELLAHYLAKFGALFGNAQMTYQERLSTIQHSKNWQEMNKGS